MDLPLLCALTIAAALALYVMLDGFDLGVGALLLLVRDEQQRDRMVASIAPTWDGNETWLVMAGVALLAAFPVAYGILLPAFYLPLIIMLLSLGLRGVSIEFRYQTALWRNFWDRIFSLGSVLAALMQGLIIGGTLQGIAVRGETFSGSVFDVFAPLPVITGLAVLAGHTLLGAGWLYLKTEGLLRDFAVRALKWATIAFASFAVGAIGLTAIVQPAARNAWAAHPLVLSTLAILAVGALVALWLRGARATDGTPFALALVIYSLGLIGLADVLFPWIVPFHIDLWAASASRLSQVLFLSGVVVVGPVVISYTAFAYRVFRGKTPVSGWGQ